MSVHDIVQPPELSESRDTLYIVHCTSYIARRTSHFVHCTSYIVHRCMLSQIEWVSYRLYWLGQNNVSPWYCTTPWTLRVSVHRTSTSYIVHRTSYIVHRTSYIVHRPSIVPPQDSSFRNHISALTASLETASMARTRSSQIYRTRPRLTHPTTVGIVTLSPSQSEYSFNLAFTKQQHKMQTDLNHLTLV